MPLVHFSRAELAKLYFSLAGIEAGQTQDMRCFKADSFCYQYPENAVQILSRVLEDIIREYPGRVAKISATTDAGYAEAGFDARVSPELRAALCLNWLVTLMIDPQAILAMRAAPPSVVAAAKACLPDTAFLAESAADNCERDFPGLLPAIKSGLEGNAMGEGPHPLILYGRILSGAAAAAVRPAWVRAAGYYSDCRVG